MAVQKVDYYEVLGVARETPADQIKSAYRKAALRWHPDRNPENTAEAEQNFRACSEAYTVLSDPQKRAIYDRYGHAGLSSSGLEQGFNASIFDEFQDIFGDLFGMEDIFGGATGGGRGRGTRARGRGQRGADLRYDLTLTFEEAAHGVRAKIKIPRRENCESCKGTGAKAGTGMVSCQTCGGHGQLTYQQGFFAISRTCPACHGEGRIIKEVCTQCRGEGRIQRERNIEVPIPAGVDSQHRIRVTGEGERGVNGGPDGDLYVFLAVKDHPFFQRHEADLYCTIPISLSQAALGAEISVPTMHGEETLEIPEGVQSGTRLRLKGRGLPNPHGGKGDLYVNVAVVTPTRLTREQRHIFEQLDKICKVENQPASRSSSFFDKVKDIFG